MFVKVLVRFMEWVLISILGLMVILVFGNVVLRYGFNSGIAFSEEVSRFLFVWMVFLGAVLTLRDNGHLGVHTLTKLLSRKGKKICKFLADSLTLACCVLLSIGAWEVISLNLRNYALNRRYFHFLYGLQCRNWNSLDQIALPTSNRHHYRSGIVSRF